MAIIGFTIVYGLYVNETALGFDRAGGNRQVWLSTCDTLVAVSNAYYNGGDVTVGNPCEGVGIEETETVAPMLSVSPNPASARVALGGLTPGQRVRVYDIKGHEWLSVESYGTTATLDISRWSRGVYVIESASSGRCKLIVE